MRLCGILLSKRYTGDVWRRLLAQGKTLTKIGVRATLYVSIDGPLVELMNTCIVCYRLPHTDNQTKGE